MTNEQWVELRVHGVSGTPPEELLASPHVLQVDGDDRSRFFHAVDSSGHVITADDGHAVEGFHWGRYTSGSWIKALWLVLLPFGLVNASAFMLPAPHDVTSNSIRFATGFRLAALAVLRFLALLLTVLLSFAISMTLIVVVGEGWASRQPFIPAWLESAIPSIMVVLSGALVALLGGVVLIARRFGRRSGEPDGVKAGGGSGLPMTPFAGPDFYLGDPDTLTLRGLHVAAGLAVPAYIALSIDGNGTVGPVASAVLLASAVVVTVLLGDPTQAATTGLVSDETEENPWHRRATRISILAVGVGLALIVWAAKFVYGTRLPESDDAGLQKKLKRLEQIEGLSEWLLYAGAIGLFLLAFTVGGLSYATRRQRASDGPAWFFRPYSKGMTTIPIAGMALFLGVGYSAAVVVGVATLLNQRKVQLGITPMLDRVAYAWALSIVPLFLILTALVVWRVRSKDGMSRHGLIGYPDDVSETFERRDAWRSKLESTVWFARVKNRVEPMLWTLVVAGTVLSVAIVLELLEIGNVQDADVLSHLSDHPEDGAAAAAFTQLGAWVLIGLMSALVFLARGAFRDASVQRSVNIIWDVVAFWPHAVHPFIPTPYSLRTVGDLAERIRHHADRLDRTDGREVVVCGHSQGSLVSFAAMNLLSQDECDRVGLLTYGSQLRLIFARAFPMYVNYDAIHRLHTRLGGAWINLYRDTDPLAGPVLSWRHQNEGTAATSGHFPGPDEGDRPDETTDPYRTRRCGDDWRLVDPVPRVGEYQAAPVNALHGHSNYWSNPEWAAALAEIRSR
jgi:hypothetical protein